MKKLPSTFLVVFISILISSSCDDSTPVTAKDKIVGGWYWIQTISGWSGDTIIPDSVGTYKTLVFEEDGTYREHHVSDENDIVFEGSYEIVRRKDGFIGKDILIIKMPSYSSYKPPEQVIEFENANTLKLSEMWCVDCDVHTYLRQIDEFPTL